MFGRHTADTSPIGRRCLIAALILAIIGFLLVVIGICLPFMFSKTDFYHAGVFQLCAWSFDGCVTTSGTGSSTTYWALAICGMIALLIAIIFMCVYLVKKIVDHCKIALGICVAIFLVIGVVLILALVIIIITDYKSASGGSLADVFTIVGFSWYLTVCGLIILLAAFICFMCHLHFMVYH